MLRVVATIFALATVMSCGAAEDPATPATPATPEMHENTVRQFVTALFSEDQKALNELCEGDMNRDMNTYFWIRSTIHSNDAPIVARPWKGKIEIVRAAKETVINTRVHLSQAEEDMVYITVDGKAFKVGVSKSNHVILFDALPPP